MCVCVVIIKIKRLDNTNTTNSKRVSASVECSYIESCNVKFKLKIVERSNGKHD